MRPLGACLLVGSVALGAAWLTGKAFGETPPAYHDEYSYLFQARTFLAGRLWFPSAVEPHLFDQMHVLNEGHFASRYFPGAGLWLAPFVASGVPQWSMWLALALCAMLVVLVAKELASLRAGLIAGLLTGLSPGILLFGNLLLAHLPTLVGLMIFLLGFYRLRRTGSLVWAFITGTGLAFAMLCRPMTAAGVALPYGAYLLWSVRPWYLERPSPNATSEKAGWEQLSLQHRLLGGLILSVPLVVGFGTMAYINREITGNALLSPYQQYTNLHTPRHVYGFYNVTRGERHLGPRVLKHYDEWAEELTPSLAAQNVRDRWFASWRWTLGMIPLGAVFWLVLAGGPAMRSNLHLLLASILSLHAAHVPYWYAGIMHWHYVFETAPLWLLVFGITTDRLFQTWNVQRRGMMKWCWTAWVAMTIFVNLWAIEDIWIGPLARGIEELGFARNRYAQFANLVKARVSTPAIVLVQGDPSDRHLDYVTNPPNLSGPVLYGRYLPKQIPLTRVKELYPNRHVYLFDAKTNQLRHL